MSDFNFNFTNPWLLFLLIPALLITLIPFFRIPKKFRRTRNRVISVSLHVLTVIFCVALIAGLYFTFTIPNRENELIIVMDVSDSNTEQADQKEEYLQTIVNMCDENYKIGIVTFGYDSVYAAPLSYDAQEVYRQYLASKSPDTTATNIKGALEFASEQFTNPKSSKIVLLSDGFETDQSAKETAQLIAARGTKIDTVSFPDQEHGEIQITDASMPKDRVVVNQSVNLSLTVENTFDNDVNVTVTVSDNNFEDQPLSVTLMPGSNEIDVPHLFQSAGMHDIIFNVTCKDGDDFVTENNVYQSYLNINVLSNILILENIQGEASELYNILSPNYNVTVMNIHNDSALIPKDAKELCAYEQVMLVNISNADLTGASMPANFDEALYEYVYTLGGSLFTAGGKNDTGADGKEVPHAYNREDMQGTLFQDMLPVQAIDYAPPVAVMIVVDSSGSMSSGRFEAAVQGAEDTLAQLNERDYCGVMSFSTSATEEISVLPVTQKDKILQAIKHLGEGEDASGSGGTVFSGAIDLAGRALSSVDVSRKHIILITDGDPSDHLESNGDNDNNWYGKYIDYNYANGITMSIVTVGGSSSNTGDMQSAAERGHGNYYSLTLDEVTQGMVSTVMSQDLAEIKLSEMQDGIEFTPTIGDHTNIFAGMNSQTVIPTLNGYYGTMVKDGASTPLMYEYVPIYAAWQYGAGSVGSFMCDLSGYWSENFINDPIGITLIKNIAESLAPMQPPEPDILDFVINTSTQNYTNRVDVYTTEELKDGESVRLTVTALSESAGNYYSQGVPVTSLGNNVSFDFSIAHTGVYRLLIEKLDAAGAVVSDVTIYRTFSYSAEYDALRDADEGSKLLADIAQNGGGTVIEDPVEIFSTFEERIAKTFNPALVLLILSVIFVLLDIAVRKFKFKWLHEIIRDRKAMNDINGAAKQGGESDR